MRWAVVYRHDFKQDAMAGMREFINQTAGVIRRKLDLWVTSQGIEHGLEDSR